MAKISNLTQHLLEMSRFLYCCASGIFSHRLTEIMQFSQPCDTFFLNLIKSSPRKGAKFASNDRVYVFAPKFERSDNCVISFCERIIVFACVGSKFNKGFQRTQLDIN